MTQSIIACPHCAADNTYGDAYCASCGKALPLASDVPHILAGAELPTSSAGAKLVGDELTKKSRSAANILLFIGILQGVLGSLGIMLQASQAKLPMSSPPVLAGLVIVGVISAVFIGLHFWARVSPLPATIIGLVVYSTLIAINVVTQLNAVARNGGNAGGFGGLGVGWLDIVIIVLLAKGIDAGVKYRRMNATTALS